MAHHLNKGKGSSASLSTVKEKQSVISFNMPEKKAAGDAKNTVLSAFEQMHRQKGSLVSLFDSSQLPALTRVCTIKRLAEGEKLMRQGDTATFLGFVITGRLKVELHGTHATSGNLGPGDIVGEMELCHGEIGKVQRKNTVEATLASTIAELSFEDFSSFVESLGSRMAKKVSKTLAHTVLDRFVHNEQQADAEDRKRLTNISTVRRNGISMPMLAGVEEVAPIIVHDRVRKDEWLAPNLRNDGPIARTGSSADRGGKSGAGVRQSLDDLMKESLATVLTRIGLFSNMDSMLKEELLDSFFLYEPAGGEVVVSTGEPQSLFYVIYRGSCGVYDIPAEFVHQAFSNVTSGAGGEVSAPSVSVSSPVKAKSRVAIRKEGSEGGNQGSFDDLDKAKSGDVALKRESSRKAFMEGEFSYKALSESPGISPRERRGNKSPNNSFRKVQGMGESKKWIQGMGESKKWNAEDSMSRTNMRSAEFNRDLSDLSQGAMSPVESARARMIQGQLDVNSSLGSILRPGGGLKKEKDKSKKKMEFQVVSMLYGGDTFNEMSLVFDSESKVTIRAMQRDVQLLAVDSQMFRRKQMAYEQQRRKEISQALLKTPWGKFLPAETFNNLVDACELVKYETGKRIVSEWDEDANNYFYQIVSGSAMEVVEKKSAADRLQSRMDWTSSRPTRSRRFSSIQVDFEKVLQEYFKGDYFCEFVLHTVSVEMDINKVHLNPTVVCEQPCICLRLARNVFRSIVGSMEALMEANTKKIEGQISPERFERRPSTFSRRPSAVGIERRPSAVGIERRPSAVGIERRPSAVGIERRPSAVGIERRPSAVGIEHRRSSSVERRSSSVERRSSSVERKSSIVKAQSTDSKVGSGSASPHQRRPSASPPPGHSSTDGGHSPLNRQGQSGTDGNLGTQLGQPTPPKHDQNDSSDQVSVIDLSSAASSMSPSNIPAGQARNTIIIEPLAQVSERMEVLEQNRADLEPVRSQSGVGQVEFSSQDGDQENDVKADQQPQADESMHGSDDGAVLAPDTTLSASTTDLGRTDDENRGSQDQDESFVGVQGKSTSGATVSREAHSGGNASKGSNNELVSQQVVSESQPIFNSREKAEKAPKFYDNMTPVTSDEVTRMATDQEDMVAAVIRNMLSDVVSNIAGKTTEGSADAERDIVSVLTEPATQETLILVDKYDQAKQDDLSHVIDTGTQDRGSPENEEKEFECYESKAGDEVGDTEAKDPVDSASAVDQVEITHVVDGMEMDVIKLQTAVAIPSLEQHQVENIVIGPEIFSKGKAESSEDVPVAEGANAHSVEGSDSADNINAAGQSEVLVLDDDDVGTPQTEDDTVNSEFGSPPVVRRRKSSLTGSVGLPPRSPGMIGMTTLDSVAESLLHVAAGKVGEIADGFARRSSGGAMWQGSRPGTQGGRPKSQGFGSRPMTQGSSSGPSRTPSRPGTHGPPGLDTWGMHFDPDQSRPNTVGSNRSLPRGENLTMTPQGSLPPFRSPAHTPSLSSATSRAQSADPTQLSDRRLRASKTLVATADEFAIPLGAQVDPALGSDDGDASSGDDDEQTLPTTLQQESDEFQQSYHDRHKTEEKSVKFPSMEREVSSRGSSSRQNLGRRAATAASRAETAAVVGGERARSARSGEGRWSVPGPGAYNLPGQNARGGRWSVSHRETGPPVISTPGPGEYNVVKTPKVLRLNQLRASTAMGSLGDVSRERSEHSLRDVDNVESEALRLRRIQQEFSMRSREEVRMSRETREAEKRRAQERRILRGEREKTRPNTVYTSVIERHISGRWDNLSSELPPTEDLAWELRAFEPVKRAYRDNGYDF